MTYFSLVFFCFVNFCAGLTYDVFNPASLSVQNNVEFDGTLSPALRNVNKVNGQYDVTNLLSLVRKDIEAKARKKTEKGGANDTSKDGQRTNDTATRQQMSHRAYSAYFKKNGTDEKSRKKRGSVQDVKLDVGAEFLNDDIKSYGNLYGNGANGYMKRIKRAAEGQISNDDVEVNADSGSNTDNNRNEGGRKRGNNRKNNGGNRKRGKNGMKAEANKDGESNAEIESEMANGGIKLSGKRKQGGRTKTADDDMEQNGPKTRGERQGAARQRRDKNRSNNREGGDGPYRDNMDEPNRRNGMNERDMENGAQRDGTRSNRPRDRTRGNRPRDRPRDDMPRDGARDDMPGEGARDDMPRESADQENNNRMKGGSVSASMNEKDGFQANVDLN